MQNEGKDLPERTYQYGRRVIHLFEALPQTKLAQTLGLQLLRAGTSVGANYREADRARSKAEFISKMGDSLKELDESSLWLRHIHDSQLVAPERLHPLRKETDELIRIFVTIIKHARSE
ncbi:four helix bundle protein [Opitutus sp. ER46]|uniref:four helix bundle protein n=1 Tax=Opitutus sp. ER46 TaxID=2161864 RepID=UPI000D3016A3|nr:four helix bundle protein [Opitutus sp. ER46]PTX98619.1 four helix bundle protein [Opitutus sp. ER46]